MDHLPAGSSLVPKSYYHGLVHIHHRTPSKGESGHWVLQIRTLNWTFGINVFWRSLRDEFPWGRLLRFQIYDPINLPLCFDTNSNVMNHQTMHAILSGLPIHTIWYMILLACVLWLGHTLRCVSYLNTWVIPRLRCSAGGPLCSPDATVLCALCCEA